MHQKLSVQWLVVLLLHRRVISYMCHGFVSAGDALGWEHLATPMSSFLAGRAGFK